MQNVPQVDCSVLSRVGQCVAVGTECEAVDKPVVLGVQDVLFRTAHRVPQANFAVLAGCGKRCSVRTERQSVDKGSVACSSKLLWHLPTSSRIPQSHNGILP